MSFAFVQILAPTSNKNPPDHEYISFKNKLDKFTLAADCVFYVLITTVCVLVLTGVIASPLSYTVIGALTGACVTGLFIEGSLLIKALKDYYHKQKNLAKLY